MRNMKIKTKTLNPDLLRKLDAYWRAANYLSVGQIYLYDNPLLKQRHCLSHRLLSLYQNHAQIHSHVYDQKPKCQ